MNLAAHFTYSEMPLGNWLRDAFPRLQREAGMAARGVRRQLVLQPAVRQWRLAVSGIVQVFSRGAGGNLREGRGEVRIARTGAKPRPAFAKEWKVLR